MGSFEQRTGILFPLLVSCIERGISEKTRATFGVFLVIIIIIIIMGIKAVSYFLCFSSFCTIFKLASVI
jgi:hypothetical protein